MQRRGHGGGLTGPVIVCSACEERTVPARRRGTRHSPQRAQQPPRVTHPGQRTRARGSLVRRLDLAGVGAAGLGRRPRARWSARRPARGVAAGRLTRLHRCDRQLHSRSAPAGVVAPLAGGCAGGGRSCPRSVRVGKRDRYGGCAGQLVWEVLWSDQTEANGALEDGDRLRRVTAFRTGSDVSLDDASEAQPTAWAAQVGHGYSERSASGSCRTRRVARRATRSIGGV